MRRGFLLDDPVPDSIALVLFHDDDAEIFLNGVPAAQLSRWTSDYGLRPISPQARAALRPGRNLLAVRCSQKRGGNTSMSASPRSGNRPFLKEGGGRRTSARPRTAGFLPESGAVRIRGTVRRLWRARLSNSRLVPSRHADG